MDRLTFLPVGALPPDADAWQFGKTAATIRFVRAAEQAVLAAKEGRLVLADFALAEALEAALRENSPQV
jgi:hypothetical protein